VTSQLLAALSWDPQIRGALIVVTAFVILPGSVYLLLATNTGAKLGFLLAAAGFFGWMAVMGWIWVVYGIGIKGDPPTWHAEEIVTGDVAERGTTEEAAGFPNGWRQLETGDPVLGDATASADKVLAPSEDAGGHGGGAEAAAAPTVQPVFDEVTDYVFVTGYAKGGENFWIPGGGLKSESRVGNPGSNIFSKLFERLKRGPFHAPHYAVIQVAPVLEVEVAEGEAPPPPEPDPDEPVVSVVMVRDLGNLRFPSLMVAISMTIVFGLIANALHRRDKEIMAAGRAAPATA
jgi:hypothetical protein